MEIVSLLPTISNDYNLIRKFILNLWTQTSKPDLLIVIYQGNEEDQLLFREKLSFEKLNVIVLTTGEKSLTHAKNIGLEYLMKYQFKYCFIYEDDVLYDIKYNELMIDFLNNCNAEMISGVQSIAVNNGSRLRSLIYILTHLYPFNDIRSFSENYSITKFKCYKTNFLYGGLSMYTKKIAENFRYDENLTRYALGEDIDFSFRVSRTFKTMLTSEIKSLNCSEGTKKFGYKNYFISKISMWTYFYKKNLKNDKKYILSFSILIFGIFLESVVLSIVKFNPKYIFYYFKDTYNVLLKNKKSDFMK